MNGKRIVWCFVSSTTISLCSFLSLREDWIQFPSVDFTHKKKHILKCSVWAILKPHKITMYHIFQTLLWYTEIDPVRWSRLTKMKCIYEKNKWNTILTQVSLKHCLMLWSWMQPCYFWQVPLYLLFLFLFLWQINLYQCLLSGFFFW